MSPGDRRKARPTSGRSRTVRPIRTCRRSGARLLHLANRQSASRLATQPALLKTSWSLPLSGDDSRTNRTQLRENVGALNPEFAIEGATTRGPVARHAITTVFDRQRIGALASETFDGPFVSGNTQAIAGHHFTEGEVTYQRKQFVFTVLLFGR